MEERAVEVRKEMIYTGANRGKDGFDRLSWTPPESRNIKLALLKCTLKILS